MTLQSHLTDFEAVYNETRATPDYTDPIELGSFIKNARVLRAELERIARQVGADEQACLERFQQLTGSEARPSRFTAVRPRSTIFDTMRAFVAENPGAEFETEDIISACGLQDPVRTQTARTFLQRLEKAGQITRIRRGLYKAQKKPKPLEPRGLGPE